MMERHCLVFGVLIEASTSRQILVLWDTFGPLMALISFARSIDLQPFCV
jgi:hypothetical protein